jgi:hypothetical protein
MRKRWGMAKALRDAERAPKPVAIEGRPDMSSTVEVNWPATITYQPPRPTSEALKRVRLETDEMRKKETQE